MKRLILLLILFGLCLATASEDEVRTGEEDEDLPEDDDDVLQDTDEDTDRLLVVCRAWRHPKARQCSSCQSYCKGTWCYKKCQCLSGRRKRLLLVEKWLRAGCPGTTRCRWQKKGPCKRMLCLINGASLFFSWLVWRNSKAGCVEEGGAGCKACVEERGVLGTQLLIFVELGRMRWFGSSVCAKSWTDCRWKKVGQWCRRQMCVLNGRRRKFRGSVKCTSRAALNAAKKQVLRNLKSICKGKVTVRRGRIIAPQCQLKIPGIPGIVKLPKLPNIMLPTIKLPQCGVVRTRIPAKTIGRPPLVVTFGPAVVKAKLCRRGLQRAELTGDLRAVLLRKYHVLLRGTLVRHGGGRMTFNGKLIRPSSLSPIPQLKLKGLRDVVVDFTRGLPRDFTLKGKAKILGLTAFLKGHIIGLKTFVGIATLNRPSLAKLTPGIIKKLIMLDTVSIAVANKAGRIAGKTYTKGISASLKVCPGTLLRKALPSKLRDKCIAAKDINLSLPTIQVGRVLRGFKLKLGSILKIWDVKLFADFPNVLKGKGVFDADIPDYEEDDDQFSFAAGIKAKFRVNLPGNKPLTFEVASKYKPDTSELICSGHMIGGVWRHAFGIPMLEVRGAYLEVGFGPGGVFGISRLGIGGYLGFGPAKVALFTRVSTDLRDAMLYAKTNKLTLREIGAFVKLNGLPRLRFPELEVLVAPKAGKIGNLVYKRGLRLTAAARLLGASANLSLKFQLTSGLPDFQVSVSIKGIRASIGRAISGTLGRVLPGFIRKILGRTIKAGVERLEILNFSLRNLVLGKDPAKIRIAFYAGVGRIVKRIRFALRLPSLAQLLKGSVVKAVKKFIAKNWKKWFWVKKGWKMLLKMVGKLVDMGKVAAKKVIAIAKRFGAKGKKLIQKYSRKVKRFVGGVKRRLRKLKCVDGSFFLNLPRLRRLRLRKLKCVDGLFSF